MNGMRLEIPGELREVLESTARLHGITVVELVQKFMRLGLVAIQMQEEGTPLQVRGEDGELVDLDLFTQTPP